MIHPAINRETTSQDTIDAWRAAALHATMDGEGPAPTEILPPFWHWIYFLEARPARELGRDGHPARGGFIPDLGLPRRMWAGGRLTFHTPLPIGQPASKRTVIEKIAEKTGRSGPLAFATLRHEVSGPDGIAITEHQDVVYRQDPAPDVPPPATIAAPTDEGASRMVRCGSTMLFRYSALTFNGHRIHYDRDYARDVEGYAGLVVHGPLIAQMLLAEAVASGPVATFSFRAASPAFDFEDIALCRKQVGDVTELWARGPDGRLIMSAQTTAAK